MQILQLGIARKKLNLRKIFLKKEESVFKSQFISFHSLHLGLVFIFTLLIAANSWADEFKQKNSKALKLTKSPIKLTPQTLFVRRPI